MDVCRGLHCNLLPTALTEQGEGKEVSPSPQASRAVVPSLAFCKQVGRFVQLVSKREARDHPA